ncbi:uncharacterized protein TrAtP1_000556 [Trichoderma atroviride]|uniref:uncharacterized protein n=1 Tax=Hypocrea atroviridis TaxID=63577 RepID=UPI0033199587|nr:hypothetical protein TrAtP1_000556 [Trichoderma atroviride]
MSTLNEAQEAKDALRILSAQSFMAPAADCQCSTALLLQTPQRLTRVPSSDTPYTFSSASQQGAEQTRRLIDHRVWEEIRACTFRDANGFFKKYFEDKDWSSRAQDVYESIKKQHIGNKWVNLAGSPDQTRLLDWLFSLQDDLLSEEQRYYCATKSTKELTGGEACRQIDLVVRRKNRKPSEAEDIRKDIAVIGELKASNHDGVKKPLIQLAVYARDVFANQPTRRYLHAFTICGSKMEPWVFDRSGCYSPGPFDIHEHPERFIRVLSGYIMMNEDELGFDTFMQREGDSNFIKIEGDGCQPQKLQLHSVPLAHRRAIVSRATSCFLAKHLDSRDYDHVAKFSWSSSERKPETDFLKLANERGVQGIARLIGHYDITNIKDIRSGITFMKRYSFRGTASIVSPFSRVLFPPQNPVNKHHNSKDNSTKRPMKRKLVDRDPKPKRPKFHQRSCLQNELTHPTMESDGYPPAVSGDGLYDNRTLRCLVISPAGRPIYKYQSPLELLEALRDAIKAHQSLYSKGNILHRDISENNIIMTDPEKDGFSGMLIDLDLAKELGSGRSGARCRTGAMEFMAIEVLRDTDHTYRHDLESFLYVLLWQCIRRGWEFVGRTLSKPSQLRGWYTGTFEDIARNKHGNMDGIAFEYILNEFPDEFSCIKPLCRELRSILFPIKDNALFTGTPSQPRNLYGPMVNAFDKAIGDMMIKVFVKCNT